jgi:hypothetical protein
VQLILGNLRASASTGNLRRNPLYLIAFLIFSVYAANKLADYVIGNDMSGRNQHRGHADLNTYQNFVMNAYLWLLIGVLYRLPTLKLMDQASGETAGASIRQPHTGTH